MGEVEARALGVLQQIPECPCYIATRTGPQTVINGHRTAAHLLATPWNLGGSVHRLPWTALNGPVRTGFESGEGHWGLAVPLAWRL